jgi:hypothetical protein
MRATTRSERDPLAVYGYTEAGTTECRSTADEIITNGTTGHERSPARPRLGEGESQNVVDDSWGTYGGDSSLTANLCCDVISTRRRKIVQKLGLAA